MISVERLVFEYPGRRALDGVSLTIRPGTITALVGPNGAGKTTLMRCIAGLDIPLSGRIVVDGIDVLEQPREAHRCIGYLSDIFGLYDALTVRQCLSFVAEAQGVAESAIAKRVEQTAVDLGLTERLGQRAGELSRGLRQRVAIGQAIIHEPRLLMLDEPASGLDPESRHELSQLLLRLQARGMTLLVSSHILAELAEYSTEMLILRDGQVVEQSAIGSAHPVGIRLHIEVAHEMADLGAQLARYPGVQLLDSDVSSARVMLELGTATAAEARQRFLARLVNDGLPVCSFVEESADLQKYYLDSMRRSKVGDSEGDLP